MKNRITIVIAGMLGVLCTIAVAASQGNPAPPLTEKAFQEAYEKAQPNASFQGDMASQIKFALATRVGKDGKIEDGYEVLCGVFPRKDYVAEFWVVDTYDPKAKVVNPKNDGLEHYPGTWQACMANPAFTVADLEKAGVTVPSDPLQLTNALNRGVRSFGASKEQVKGKWGFLVRFLWWDENTKQWYKHTIAKQFPK